MKMWKKFAAALLVAAMALTMLTACGGSGTAAVKSDKEQTAKVVAAVNEFAESAQMKVKLDETLDPVIDAALPSAVDVMKASMKGDYSAYTAAYQKMTAAAAEQMTNLGKVGYVMAAACQGDPTKETIQALAGQYGNAAMAALKQAGINNPDTYAVGAVKEDGITYMFFVITGQN